MIWLNLLFFVLACVILSQSSTYLVKSLSKISYFLKLNEFTVGFIIVAVATSLPETFLGVMSALKGTPGFSVGNVIGSNIIDVTLIIGIGALLAKRINVESKIIKKDMIYMFLIVLLPVFLLMDHNIWWKLGLFPDMVQGLSRLDGAILLFVFAWYIYGLMRQETKFSKVIDHTTKKDASKYFVYFIITLTLLLVSSNFVITYATILSADLNITPFLIGIFLISVGTTLPELMFTVKSVFARQESMAIGDIIGSVITNSTLVLGVTAIIQPVMVNSLVYLTSTLFMIFSAFIFLTFAESDSGLSWNEGIALIMLYFLFIIIESYINTVHAIV